MTDERNDGEPAVGEVDGEPAIGETAGQRPIGETAEEPAEVSEPGGGTILTDVAALAAERDEYLGALQRMKADFDNYRKRVVRQQAEQAARESGALVAKLLPVLDNLDLAWAHLGDEKGGEVSEEARALDQSRRQLLDVLAREGLERVDEVEVPFDPTVHDAVAQAPASPGPPPPRAQDPATGAAGRSRDALEAAGEGDAADASPRSGADVGSAHEVDEVMRAGYRWRGQVLRPAMVRVRG
ncbi:MAG: nucleotide exchange factor GrpE [Candidatus Dormibacteraceae bacterium]